MSITIACLNGQFLSTKSAAVSLFDRCFLYGDGLFETIRISAGRPMHWHLHYARLARGAHFLRIPIPFHSDELLAQAIQLSRVNSHSDGLLRLTLSRGVGIRGYSTLGADHPSLAMTLHPFPAGHTQASKGWKVILSSVRVPAHDPLTRFKTCNRLHYILARMEAQDVHADDALLRNQEGHVVESSCANLFWIHDNILHTPPLDSGALEGITRSLLLAQAAGMETRIVEKDIRPEQLQNCQGLFLTLTSHGVVPITTLDGQSMPSHPIIARCAELLRGLSYD
jgi:branched-chain amino acid aminotransferase